MGVTGNVSEIGKDAAPADGNLLRGAVGFEIKPESQYTFFADPRVLDFDSLVRTPMEIEGAGMTLIPVIPPYGKKIEDCIFVAERDAVAAAREQCAKIADATAEYCEKNKCGCSGTAKNIASEIRK